MAAAMVTFLSDGDQPIRSVPKGGAGSPRTNEALNPPVERSNPRGTVLVVDDDDALRETVVGILGYASYNVLQSGDGDEGLRVLGDQSVDVLLLDLQMPGRDGISVLEALGPPPPKVILISAFARYSPEDIDRMGLGHRITRALRKPVPPVQLLTAVNDAMNELPHGD